MLAAAPYFAHMLPGLLSLEAWGGATFDVALRFLKEDPWDRLAALHEAVPNICLQMLIRGRNTVGYTPYPDEVATAFVTEAARTGVDIFRIFDALNDVDQMVPAIRAVAATGESPRPPCATPATWPARASACIPSTITWPKPSSWWRRGPTCCA